MCEDHTPEEGRDLDQEAYDSAIKAQEEGRSAIDRFAIGGAGGAIASLLLSSDGILFPVNTLHEWALILSVSLGINTVFISLWSHKVSVNLHGVLAENIYKKRETQRGEKVESQLDTSAEVCKKLDRRVSNLNRMLPYALIATFLSFGVAWLTKESEPSFSLRSTLTFMIIIAIVAVPWLIARFLPYNPPMYKKILLEDDRNN